MKTSVPIPEFVKYIVLAIIIILLALYVFYITRVILDIFKSPRGRLKRAIVYIAVHIWALVVLFPFYWLITTSIKLPLDVFRGPKYIPWVDFTPNLHAWHYILKEIWVDVWRHYSNSIIAALTSSFFALVIGTLAGYALTRFRYRVPLIKWKNKDIAFWVISQRMLPPVAIVIPFIYMYNRARLIDTRFGLILAYVVFNLPFVVWIMRDFFASIPVELEESALIDGCSRLESFWRIVLPLSTPGLVATYLFCLVFSWNEYLFALMLMFRNMTMPVLIAGQNNSRGPEWWYISSLSLLCVAPMVIIGLLLQRYIVKGLVVGAIKG